jgi:predicted Zn-dependent protease
VAAVVVVAAAVAGLGVYRLRGRDPGGPVSRSAAGDGGEPALPAECVRRLGPDLERRLAAARPPTLAPEEARRMLEDLVTACPASAVIQSLLGNALVRLGRGGEGEARFREALRLAPRYQAPRHNLGVALVRSGRPVEAIPWLTEVLAAAPDHPSARLVRAQARLLAQDAAGAVEDLRAHTASHARDVHGWLLLEQALIAAGDRNAARTAACRAGELGLADARERCERSASYPTSPPR